MTTTQQTHNHPTTREGEAQELARVLDVANTIRQQIGEGALMRVGARSFSALGGPDDQAGGLGFLLTHTTAGGARRVMYATVVLTHRDDYTVELYTTKAWQGHRVAVKTVATHEGIYCDQLARLIQTEAGELRSESAPSVDVAPLSVRAKGATA